MSLSKYKKKENVFLRSKVARRIFSLFIVCALFPLGALALFSYNQVTDQLQRQADKRLHQASKAAGMSVIERLTFLETDMKIITSRLRKGTVGALEPATREFKERLARHFKGLALIGDEGRIIDSTGAVHMFPLLSSDEQRHIYKGKTLVKVSPGVEGAVGVFMAMALDPGQPGKGLLFGEVKPGHLWGPEGFLSPMTELFVFDEHGNVLFASSPGRAPAEELSAAMGKNPVFGRFEWTRGNEAHLAGYWTIFMSPQFFDKWMMVYSQSKADILEPLNTFKKIFQLVVVLSFLVVGLLSLRQIRRSLVPIELLKDATRRVADRDFSNPVKITSDDEFEELGSSFNEMADNLDTHLRVMAAINHVGMSLSAEKDTNRLMEIILLGAKSITNADGGALYTVAEDKHLRLSAMYIDSLNLEMDSVCRSSIPLYDEEGRPNTNIVAAYSVLNDATINIPDIYAEEGFDFSGNRDFDREADYRSRSFLSVPMKNHENEVIGVLQLTNAKDKLSQEFVPFSEESRRMAETLAAQAAVALTKNKLVENFKRLFDALMELIATAIDEKSSYTGSHCRRVPDLTMMLAEAVSNRRDGFFKDFNLSEEEMYELRVAAMLHDCGKVTTPTHIVDKTTKLETIFDRIHLVDTRFEVLKRDAQIEFLRNKLAALNGGQDLSELEEEIKTRLSRLEEDRDFVRSCNNGREYMAEKDQDKLREVARKYRWVNAKGEEEPILSEDEVYNLAVPKGTITAEEREVINQHVKTTIKMLESLPYPKSLRNVPRFAEAHHERMDGKGYPRGLTREQIPVQGRIIALSDIFEALTAKDRPYKKGLTLMEALRIMGAAAQEGQIDPDLFNVFINEKVYLRYAEKYLPPEQIDEVVPSKIPGYAPAQPTEGAPCKRTTRSMQQQIGQGKGSSTFKASR